MNVHNIMEEMVYEAVNDLFDTAKANKTPWLTCSCNQCRLDTICYVLNKMPPRYITSGRGLAYSQLEESIDKSQLSADISRIGLEGMKKVLSSKRPHSRSANDLPDSPVFNFPTFVGRIFDGQTFEPVKDVSVLLLLNSEKAVSIDQSWENPYHVTAHTPGTFIFWVKPVSVEKEGLQKVFPFEIHVDRRGYDPIRYFFEIALTSESVVRTAYTAEHAFILPDLHLFPLKDGLEGMQE